MLGDQVYADEIGMAFIKEWHDGSTGNDDARAANERASTMLYAKLADLYQDSWMHPDTRKVLATAATLMIKDDHEVLDDSLPRKFAQHPAFIVYSEVALRAYRDFQLALRLIHDAEATTTPSTGGVYTWPVGEGTSIHLVDCSYPGFDDAAAQSVRSFLKTPWLTRAIVACSCLPFPDQTAASSKLHKFIFGEKGPSGRLGVWSKESATAVFRELLDFTSSGAREAAVVGGDWHAALTGVVSSSEAPLQRQQRSGGAAEDGKVMFMCSSGITNVCSQVDVDASVNPVRRCNVPNALLPGMQVTCDPQTAEPRRNYGVVYTSGDSGGGGLTVRNKFASKPSKFASVSTRLKHVVGLARAAYFGWLLKHVL
jgi:hypothetical protein